MIHKSVNEVIADFHKRLDKIETGTKPMVLLSEEQTDNFTVQFGDGSGRENVVRSYEFSFPDSVDPNPMAVPYIDFSFTGGNSALVNWWYPEHRLTSDQKKSYVDVYVINFADAQDSNVTIRVRWVYLAASSSSI